MSFRFTVFIGFFLSCFCNAPALNSSSAQDDQTKVSITPRKLESRTDRPAPNLRLDIKMVLIPVTVADTLDRPVTNLPAERFRVLEDGVAQRITSFSQEESPVSL